MAPQLSHNKSLVGTALDVWTEAALLYKEIINFCSCCKVISTVRNIDQGGGPHAKQEIGAKIVLVEVLPLT